MLELLHELIYQNLGNMAVVVSMESCSIYVTSTEGSTPTRTSARLLVNSLEVPNLASRPPRRPEMEQRAYTKELALKVQSTYKAS